MNGTTTILAIDDDPMVLEHLKHCLRPQHQLRLATLGSRGLELARATPRPDLILLDVKLPDMHGYDVCAALKKHPQTADIPVIFLSSQSDAENITYGLEVGAVDYVGKPFNRAILVARVRTQLRLHEANRLLQDHNTRLEEMVRRRTQALQAQSEELQLSEDLTIIALGSIAETRDNETGNHIHRTRAYVGAMAQRLSGGGRWRETMQPADWSRIVKAAPLHDIGKVGIPDQILLKPGRLTEDEFHVMKTHPAIGRNALRAAETRSGSHRALLRSAIEISYCHHERWDGSGYPEGIAGDAIPLSARLMAVADVYDALISNRVYKPAWPHAVAVDLIRDGRGRHFDPSVTDCFLDCHAEFAAIATHYSDTHEVQ